MKQHAQSKKKTTILIVDDDTEIIQVMVEAITEMGYAIETAENGFQALEILKSKPIDLVLSDIMMEPMNGMQLLAKCQKANMLVPFVFMTGYCGSEHIIAAVRLGAIDFLPKPIGIPELELVLKRVTAIAERLAFIDELIRSIGTDVAPYTLEQLDSLRRQINFLRVMGTNVHN